MYSLKEIVLPDKMFISKLCKIAIPIAFQNLSASILAIIDVIIIKDLGQSAIASVSLAGQIFFVTNLITFGITSGGSVFLSYNFGKNDYKGLKKSYILIVLFSIFINLIFVLIATIVPKTILSVFTHEQDLITNGSSYLLISAPGFLFYAISNSYTALFRCANKAHYALIISTASLLVKTFLNIVLIYGFLGLPSLGIKGAGLATLLSKFFELIMCIIVFYYYMDKKYRLEISDFFNINVVEIRLFLKGTYPVILNESLWGIGIASFSIIYGRMGENTVAAIGIAKTMEEICNVFFYGLAIGTLIIIGHEIGAKNYDNVKLYARRLAVIGFEIGIVIMIGMLLIKNLYVNNFFAGIPLETRNLSKTIIIIFALYMPARSLASVIIMGVLRAGGDSIRAAYYDVLPIYLLSLPIGFILGLVFKLPIYIVLPVMYSKRAVKCILSIKRLISGKWIKK